MKGKFEKPRKKRLLLSLAAALLVFVLSAAILAAGYYHSILGKLNHVDVPKAEYTLQRIDAEETAEETLLDSSTAANTLPDEEVHVPSSADYINFLVVGQAAREGETERFADTMILCTVNTYEKTLTMTSLLRDTLVKMPDYRGRTGGKIKLTTIYHLGSTYGDGIAGSMELMNQTLYDNFGIEVDHNFEVDFDTFIQVIDMLGGIDVELTEAEAEYLNADDIWVYQDVEPGMAHLDGMTALCYARMRKAKGDAESDIIRTSRQRNVIVSIMDKLKKASLSEVQSMTDEILPMIATSMDNREITQMVFTLLPILPELRIERNGTCPVKYWGDMVDIYSDGMLHSVLLFDKNETKAAMREITEGEISNTTMQ